MAIKSTLEFTPGQRHDLEKAGLPRFCINGLQRELPRIAAAHAEKESREAIGKEFGKILRPLNKALMAIGELEDRAARDRSRDAAIAVAEIEDHLSFPILHRPLRNKLEWIIGRLHEAEQSALAGISGRRRANPAPAAMIVRFVKAAGVDLLPSPSPSSRCTRIVRICYEAAGLPGPSRTLGSLREYMERASPGSAGPPRGAGRPRKRGR
ncbi:MAG: hypothetical protein LBE59_02185 [Nevskiaceae bacterium]|jgi:hypothetical protein|nr:hypothetical protein [Nevskiaceae bacterium]